MSRDETHEGLPEGYCANHNTYHEDPAAWPLCPIRHAVPVDTEAARLVEQCRALVAEVAEGRESIHLLTVQFDKARVGQIEAEATLRREREAHAAQVAVLRAALQKAHDAAGSIPAGYDGGEFGEVQRVLDGLKDDS